MSEEEEPTELEELVGLLEKSADSTLILNLISPYLTGDRRGKLTKLHQDLLEIIRILVVNQMKLQNDFRVLIMYLNKKNLLDVDNAEVPQMKTCDPDTMYL